MWYQSGNNEKVIDYKKPIIAKCDGKVLMLMPQIRDNYKVVGYNWFNINTGLYNSCCLFKTPQDAIKSCGIETVYNVDIEVRVL